MSIDRCFFPTTMSDKLLDRFNSAVQAFDSFIDSLPDNVGAHELQELMQGFLPRLVSDISPETSQTETGVDSTCPNSEGSERRRIILGRGP